MALNIVLKETETLMKKSLESTQREFAELRSGRANPRMVEGIRVNYYGTPTLLKDISTISIDSTNASSAFIPTPIQYKPELIPMVNISQLYIDRAKQAIDEAEKELELTDLDEDLRLSF